MENKIFDPQRISARLLNFNYKYEVKGKVLKIHLPMLCFLKIEQKEDKIKISSHILFGFRYFTIEANFMIYGLALYLLSFFQWNNLNKGIFVLGGIFLVYLVVCIIKIEAMRSILHNWMEKDSEK